jgi:hypothetical protein
MAEENVSFELREPAAPEQLLPRDLLQPLWLGLGLLAAVALAVLLVWWFRRPAGSGAQPVREQAFREALAGLAQLSAPTARGAAVQASLLLRTYLSLAARDPALFETHEEFIARSDSLKVLTEPAQAACRDGFARLAALKYSPEPPDSDPAAVVTEARGLLETLHRGFAA